MKNILIKILIFIILMQLGGCRWFTAAGRPFLGGLDFKIPDGTPTFQQGFKDGCSTILYARGNGLYRDRYEYRYDPKMIGNPEYRFGHSRGQSYCFQNLIGPNPISSFDRYLMPHGNNTTSGYGVFDMQSADIGGAWDGFFGGGAPQTISNVTGSSLNSIFGAWGGGGSSSVFNSHPIWGGSSSGQIFGQ